MARHNNIALGVFSKLLIIVEPVVVIPDMLSKNESVTENSIEEKIKGSEPNIAILNQDNAVKRKACCRFNFLSWSRFDKKNKVPNIIVAIEKDYGVRFKGLEVLKCNNVGALQNLIDSKS